MSDLEVRTVLGFFQGATVYHAGYNRHVIRGGATTYSSLCGSAGDGFGPLLPRDRIEHDPRRSVCVNCARMIREGFTRDALGTPCEVQFG
jgi:hypothetical protein